MESIGLDGYTAAREHCAWFHRPELAAFRMGGSEALDFLNRLTTNELRDLQEGQFRQTILCNDKGRVVSLLTVIPLASELIVLCDASLRDEVIRHLKQYAVMDDVRFALPEGCSGIELCGPTASEALLYCIPQLPAVPIGTGVQKVTHENQQLYIIATTNLPDRSFLIFQLSSAVNMTELSMIFERSVLQLQAADVELLRIESGVAKQGSELSTEHNPLEANLLHLVNFKKGCYVGQEVIARLDSYNKVKQRLVGFRCADSASVGRQVVVDETNVGILTSVDVSPQFGPIALGYIRTEHAIEGRACFLRTADTVATTIAATVVMLPFTNAKD